MKTVSILSHVNKTPLKAEHDESSVYLLWTAICKKGSRDKMLCH